MIHKKKEDKHCCATLSTANYMYVSKRFVYV